MPTYNSRWLRIPALAGIGLTLIAQHVALPVMTIAGGKPLSCSTVALKGEAVG